MSPRQRTAALKRFMSTSIISYTTNTSSSTQLAGDVGNPLVVLSLPSYIADEIWHKACEFECNDICKAPGSDSCWVVKSNSGKPYLIEKTALNKFSCDTQCCITFKSSSICSHTVAVTDNLSSFINWHIRNKHSVNLTSLSQV